MELRDFSFLQPKTDPEAAAKELCRGIRKIFFVSFCPRDAVYDPKFFEDERIRAHGLREKYLRARGNEFGSRLVGRADRVCRKVGEIVNRNPDYWNPRRRGQQIRRLRELLWAFESEERRSASNVVPLMKPTACEAPAESGGK